MGSACHASEDDRERGQIGSSPTKAIAMRAVDDCCADGASSTSFRSAEINACGGAFGPVVLSPLMRKPIASVT
jgi:hypothetical protein